MVEEATKMIILQTGAIGGVLVFMLWINYKIGLKLVSVIESNTKGYTEVKEAVREVKIAVHRSSDTIEKNTSTLVRVEQINKALMENLIK